MLLYTIMMVLLVASTSLQHTLERRPTPFSKHKRRTSVVLENNSSLQLRQRPPQMARFWAISICRRAVEPPSSTPCLVSLLYTIMMVLLVASTSLQRTLERRPIPFSKHKRRTSVVLENNSPLKLRQRPPQMARSWVISVYRRAVEPPSSIPSLVTLLRLSE